MRTVKCASCGSTVRYQRISGLDITVKGVPLTYAYRCERCKVVVLLTNAEYLEASKLANKGESSGTRN